MTRTAAGERVRVRQLRVEEWAVGAAEALSGLLGTVTTDHAHREGKVLVTFDAPASPWSSNQMPARAWWFDPYELEPAPRVTGESPA